MLLSTVAAGYLSGVMAFQFLNVSGLAPEQVLTAAVRDANAQFLIAAAFMVIGGVMTLSAARALYVGLGIRNPLRALRGPIALSIVGMVLTLILNLPGIFLILVAGFAWGAYRIFDETYNPVVGGPRLARNYKGDRSGDLSEMM
jgi:hypothetical protein